MPFTLKHLAIFLSILSITHINASKIIIKNDSTEEIQYAPFSLKDDLEEKSRDQEEEDDLNKNAIEGFVYLTPKEIDKILKTSQDTLSETGIIDWLKNQLNNYYPPIKNIQITFPIPSDKDIYDASKKSKNAECINWFYNILKNNPKTLKKYYEEEGQNSSNTHSTFIEYIIKNAYQNLQSTSTCNTLEAYLLSLPSKKKFQVGFFNIVLKDQLEKGVPRKIIRSTINLINHVARETGKFNKNFTPLLPKPLPKITYKEDLKFNYGELFSLIHERYLINTDFLLNAHTTLEGLNKMIVNKERKNITKIYNNFIRNSGKLGQLENIIKNGKVESNIYKFAKNLARLTKFTLISQKAFKHFSKEIVSIDLYLILQKIPTNPNTFVEKIEPLYKKCKKGLSMEVTNLWMVSRKIQDYLKIG